MRSVATRPPPRPHRGASGKGAADPTNSTVWSAGEVGQAGSVKVTAQADTGADRRVISIGTARALTTRSAVAGGRLLSPKGLDSGLVRVTVCVMSSYRLLGPLFAAPSPHQALGHSSSEQTNPGTCSTFGSRQWYWASVAEAVGSTLHEFSAGLSFFYFAPSSMVRRSGSSSLFVRRRHWEDDQTHPLSLMPGTAPVSETKAAAHPAFFRVLASRAVEHPTALATPSRVRPHAMPSSPIAPARSRGVQQAGGEHSRLQHQIHPSCPPLHPSHDRHHLYFLQTLLIDTHRESNAIVTRPIRPQTNRFLAARKKNARGSIDRIAPCTPPSTRGSFLPFSPLTSLRSIA